MSIAVKYSNGFRTVYLLEQVSGTESIGKKVSSKLLKRRRNTTAILTKLLMKQTYRCIIIGCKRRSITSNKLALSTALVQRTHFTASFVRNDKKLIYSLPHLFLFLVTTVNKSGAVFQAVQT